LHKRVWNCFLGFFFRWRSLIFSFFGSFGIFIVLANCKVILNLFRFNETWAVKALIKVPVVYSFPFCNKFP
jgi:hypothetical protein